MLEVAMGVEAGSSTAVITAQCVLAMTLDYERNRSSLYSQAIGFPQLTPLSVQGHQVIKLATF
jgi:hypothetical protein